MHNAARAHYKSLSELLIFKAWRGGTADGDDDAETKLLNRTPWPTSMFENPVLLGL